MADRQSGREQPARGRRRTAMRRRINSVVLVSLAVFLVGCDWTTFGFDAAHTRHNAKDTSISKVSAPELTAVWRGSTGGGISSSPSVAAGAVYVGSGDGFLYAFDAKAGTACALYLCAPLWRGATGGAVFSSPAVAAGVAYVGSGDGRLYAFSVAGCAPAPTVPCSPSWVGVTDGPITSSPVVSNGVVYVGSGDGRLYAFGAAGCGGPSGGTCGPRWRAFTSGPVSSSPAVAGGLVYVGSDNGRVYAYDAAGCAGAPATACTEVWRGVTGGAVRSSPSVAHGMVYVGSDDGRLYAFDAAGCAGAPGTACSPLWRAVTGGAVSSSPAVADGVVYVGSTDRRLYAFNAAASSGCSGAPVVCAPRWVGATNGPVSSSPAVANGVVYVGSDDQNLYGFATTGPAGCAGTPAVCAPLWIGRVGGTTGASSPAVADGFAFVGSAAGKLVSFRAVVDPIASSLESGVVTPDRADIYGLTTSGNSATATARATNVSVNTRIAFWRKSEPAATDHQSCATWSGQSADVNQQGAVLRLRELPDGSRRGILVTKNIWLNANWIFNVHVWDTNAPEVYTPIAAFDLAAAFRPNGQVLPFPWRLCARVVGNVVSFVVWPAGSPRPAWTDATHGGSVTLPGGWSAPGLAGWYIGHLRPGDGSVFSALDSGPVAQGASGLRASFAPAPTTPPRAPLVGSARL